MGLQNTQSKYQKLMNTIEQDKMVFSYSSIKHLVLPDGSPQHFIRYKMKVWKQTAAARKGTLRHVVVLEPEELEEKYIIKSLKEPSTVNAQAFCDNIIEQGMSRREAFIKAEYRLPKGAKTDSPSQKQAKIKSKIDETFNQYSDYIETFQLAKSQGKEVATPQQVEDAIKLKDALYRNKGSRRILEGITQTEVAFPDKGVEFKLFGHPFRGYVDGVGNHILDLKFSRNPSPSDFYRDFHFTWKYYIQSYIYQAYYRAQGIDKEVKYIVCDDFANIGCYNIRKENIEKGRLAVKAAVESYNRCRLMGDWGASYDWNAGVIDEYTGKPKHEYGHLGIFDL